MNPSWALTLCLSRSTTSLRKNSQFFKCFKMLVWLGLACSDNLPNLRSAIPYNIAQSLEWYLTGSPHTQRREDYTREKVIEESCFRILLSTTIFSEIYSHMLYRITYREYIIPFPKSLCFPPSISANHSVDQRKLSRVCFRTAPTALSPMSPVFEETEVPLIHSFFF